MHGCPSQKFRLVELVCVVWQSADQACILSLVNSTEVLGVSLKTCQRVLPSINPNQAANTAQSSHSAYVS